MHNNFPSRRDELFDALNSMNWLNRITGDGDMKTDVSESSSSFTVKIDLPDVDKKDINVDYDDNVLTVSAKRDSFSDESNHDGTVIMNERSSGRFSRQYHLPKVDVKKIEASYDSGVLKIVLPKTPHSDPEDRKIEIK